LGASLYGVTLVQPDSHHYRRSSSWGRAIQLPSCREPFRHASSRRLWLVTLVQPSSHITAAARRSGACDPASFVELCHAPSRRFFCDTGLTSLTPVVAYHPGGVRPVNFFFTHASHRCSDIKVMLRTSSTSHASDIIVIWIGACRTSTSFVF
jgi:hypothetical protein